MAQLITAPAEGRGEQMLGFSCRSNDSNPSALAFHKTNKQTKQATILFLEDVEPSSRTRNI